MQSHRSGDATNAQPQIYRDIDRAMRSNDIVRAIALARAALDAGHVHPVLLNLRAYWKKQQGQLEDALTDLAHARELAPGSAELLSETADCLNGLGLHRRALAAATEALRLNGNLAAAWYRKALALHMLGQFEAARGAYRETVRLNPLMADAHARLANMAVTQGDTQAARDHAARALAVEPGNAMALLARVACEVAEEHFEAAERQLGAILADASTPAPVRAAATAQAGDVCDAMGRTSEAFAAYRDSGMLWRAFYERRVRRPAPESPCEQLSRIAAKLKAMPAGLRA